MRELLGMMVGILLATLAMTAVALFGLVALLVVGLAVVALDMPTEPVTASARAPAPSRGEGEVAIQTIAMVQVYIDGEMAAYDRPSASYVARLPAGSHVVQVRNAWMKEVARYDVTIRSGRRVLLEYENKGKTFRRVGETAARASAPAAAVAAPAPVQVQVQAAAPAPAPGGGLFASFREESTSTSRSSASSTRYGQTTTSVPGQTRTEGYQDTVSAEQEDSRRRVFGF